MDDELLASHVDAVYAAAREDFTAERNKRVKELRAAGCRDEAGALAERRKPTLPAWAVDQLDRQRPEQVEELITTADELRAAQRRAASGRGDDGLRTASRALRGLVADLREEARQVFEAAGGRPESHLDDVEQTLFAAAVEPEHHDDLRRGWFSSTLEAAGFGGAGALLLVPDSDEVEENGGSDARHGEEKEAREADRESERQDELERRREAERAARRRELERRRAQLLQSRDRQRDRVDRATAKADDLRERANKAASEADEQYGELSRIDEDLRALDDELPSIGS